MPTTQYFSLLPNSTDLYNLNPAPMGGQGPYGKVPGTIGAPPNLYRGVSSIYPGLLGDTATATNLVRSQMAGEFTPEDENANWDLANRFGVGAGMPGAGLWSNKFMGNVVGARQRLEQQGLENFQNLTGKLAQLVDQPELLATIAARNAAMGAAPDPAQAAAEQQRIYNEAMAKVMDQIQNTRGPAGGTITTTTRGPSYGGGGYNPGASFPGGSGALNSWMNTPAVMNDPAQLAARNKAYDDYWRSQGYDPRTGQRTLPSVPAGTGQGATSSYNPDTGETVYATSTLPDTIYSSWPGTQDFFDFDTGGAVPTQYDYPIGPELAPWTDFGTPPAGVPADYWYTGEDWGEEPYYAVNDWSGFEDWIP